MKILARNRVESFTEGMVSLEVLGLLRKYPVRTVFWDSCSRYLRCVSDLSMQLSNTIRRHEPPRASACVSSYSPAVPAGV